MPDREHAANVPRSPVDDPLVMELPKRSPREGGKPATKPPVRFNRTSANKIMATIYPPLRWAIEGYLAEGFAVMAGRQKLGKTWLALDWSIAKATAGFAMGSIPVNAGDVLYLDLENGHRRIQRRIEVLFPDERNRPDLSRLDFVTTAPMLGAGLIAELERWRQSVPEPSLVVIDVLQRVKPPGRAGQNAYEADYSTFADLQQWATTNGIAVLGLHHTRKGGADDPLEALSGSNGLSACADATLLLDRDGAGTTLYVRGRDVIELETAVTFDGGIWSILGEAGEVRRSGERSRLVTALVTAGEPVTIPDLVAETGMKNANVRKLLPRMVKDGEAQKVKRGLYAHCDWKEPPSQPPGHNGHIITFPGGGEP